MFDIKICLAQPDAFVTMFFQDMQFRFITKAVFVNKTIADTHKSDNPEIDCLVRYNDRIIRDLDGDENSAFFFKTRRYMIPNILGLIMTAQDGNDGTPMLDWIRQELEIGNEDVLKVYKIVQKKDFGDQVATIDGGK